MKLFLHRLMLNCHIFDFFFFLKTTRKWILFFFLFRFVLKFVFFSLSICLLLLLLSVSCVLIGVLADTNGMFVDKYYNTTSFLHDGFNILFNQKTTTEYERIISCVHMSVDVCWWLAAMFLFCCCLTEICFIYLYFFFCFFCMFHFPPSLRERVIWLSRWIWRSFVSINRIHTFNATRNDSLYFFFRCYFTIACRNTALHTCATASLLLFIIPKISMVVVDFFFFGLCFTFMLLYSVFLIRIRFANIKNKKTKKKSCMFWI